MATPLRVLIVEDSENDMLLLLRELRRGGFDPAHARVDTPSAMRAALDRQAWDAILCDYAMPHFSAPDALSLLREIGLDLPFIIVSGTIGEDTAVAAMKRGAHDYLLKNNLARLLPAVERELREAKEREARRQAEGALRETAETLRAIIEASPLAIIALEPDGTVRLWNPAAERIFGWSAAEVLGGPLPFVPADKQEEFRALRQRVLQGEAFSGVEIRRQRKDGSPIDVSLSTAPLHDTHGGITGIVAIVADISERKRAEAALRAKDEEIRTMTQQLWQAAKLATMGELAASIAHELNNPLATVSLRVESLLAQVPDEHPMRRALEVIEHEAERMGTLVTNLLQFSRRSQVQISTLDVREEIERTLELIHYHLRNRRIGIAREFAPDVPMIQADRQALRQLFLNLFSNASDAMPDGGTLTIRVFQKAEGSGQEAGGREPEAENASLLPPAAHILPSVVIEVADTGVGISPEDLPKVTDPFFTTKPEGKGTGLGLAICRRIVEEHGGMLDIASEMGRGTAVRITLAVRNSTDAVLVRETR